MERKYARLVVRPDKSTPGDGLIIGYSKGLFKPGVVYQAQKPLLDPDAAKVVEIGPHPFSLTPQECYSLIGVSHANSIGHVLVAGGNYLWLTIDELRELGNEKRETSTKGKEGN